MASVEDFVSWIKSIPVKEVIPKRPLTSAQSDASLVDVLEQLRALKIHSLPVVHATRGTVLGMVDVLDIVCSVYDLADLEQFNKDGTFDAGDVASAFINLDPLREKLSGINASRMIRKAAPARSEVIASLPASFEGPEMPNYNVTVEDSVYSLLAKLGWGALHRVPVLAPALANETEGADSVSCDGDSNSEMVDVVCQSDVLRFLAENIDKLPRKLLDSPISKFSTNLLCKVGLTASMAEVLWLFKQRKVLSLVVEDHNGGFVGAISAQDFIQRAGDLTIYGMAVDEFIDFKPSSPIQPTRMLQSSTTLGEAISYLAESRQYRVWISDGEKCAHTNRPILNGVLSIRDVIKALWKSDPENSRAQVCED